MFKIWNDLMGRRTWCLHENIGWIIWENVIVSQIEHSCMIHLDWHFLLSIIYLVRMIESQGYWIEQNKSYPVVLLCNVMIRHSGGIGQCHSESARKEIWGISVAWAGLYGTPLDRALISGRILVGGRRDLKWNNIRDCGVTWHHVYLGFILWVGGGYLCWWPRMSFADGVCRGQLYGHQCGALWVSCGLLIIFIIDKLYP